MHWTALFLVFAVTLQNAYSLENILPQLPRSLAFCMFASHPVRHPLSQMAMDNMCP